MPEAYFQDFHVRWSDLDPNMHMRHTAYGDMCAATRFSFLDSLGFTMKEFAKLQVGPVIFNENLQYLKEVRAGETVRVDVRVSGLSEDSRKWKMRHQVIRLSDNKVSAIVEVQGAWLSLTTRKITPAPEVLQSAMGKLVRTDDFEVI